LLDLVFW